MGKRLWIVSELYYPETTSTGYILTQIAEGLSECFAVNVICGQPTYSARGTKALHREQRNGVSIRRCWGTTLDKDILPLRLVNLVTITLSLFLTALFSLHRDDLVLVVTNPPSLPFAIALACKLRNARCSMIVHDVYPDSAIAAGKLEPASPVARYLDRLNEYLYRSMHHIFVLGRDMKDRVAQKLDKQKERLVIATNWADLDLLTPTPRSENPLLIELGITGKFVVQYAGNMGYPNDIETIVRAVIRLKEREDIHFVFIGSGAKKPQVESAVGRNGLTNVTVLGQRPRSDQNNFLNACDVALIALVNGMKGVSVPSRMYNTLAAGKPIIAVAEEGSELALVIQEECVGWVVEPGQPEQLIAAILQAKSQPDLLADMSAKARRVAETKYTFDRVLEVFRTGLSTST